MCIFFHYPNMISDTLPRTHIITSLNANQSCSICTCVVCVSVECYVFVEVLTLLFGWALVWAHQQYGQCNVYVLYALYLTIIKFCRFFSIKKSPFSVDRFFCVTFRRFVNANVCFINIKPHLIPLCTIFSLVECVFRA